MSGRIFSILCAAFITSTANAAGWLNPVMTLTTGMATASVGENQTLTNPNDATIYQYGQTGAYSTQWLFGAFLGTELALNAQWDVLAGFGYYQPAVFSGGGILTQGVDAASSNQYSYNYRVASQQLVLEATFLYKYAQYFQPYLSAGLGAARNKVYRYTTTVPPFITFTPQFNDNTNTTVSYFVGAGIDADIYQQWRIGAGYRFTDLGRANLGAGNVDVSAIISGLSQQHLYAHEVIAQVSYLFL